MLIVKVKKGESIEKALKRYKLKVNKTKQTIKLREGQEYEKPSSKKRKQKQKAKYLEMKKGLEN
tara:strand:+ start:766 stop:957 length:192 start_codon:yes stop_codon:yes gene_type:complete